MDRALTLLRSALALDPDFTRATVMAAVCRTFRRSLDKDDPGEAEEAVRAARKVAAAEPGHLMGLSWAGLVLGYCAMDSEAGYAAVERALALNPSSVEARVVAGYLC